MALWQKIAIGVGLFIALVAVGVWGAFRLTSGAADAASGFIAEIAHSGPEKAYGDAAPVLRLAQSEDVFAAQTRQWHLTDAASSTWPSRSYKNGQMSVTGTVTLKSGQELPLRVDLVKVGSKWEVSGMTLNAGAQDDSD